MLICNDEHTCNRNTTIAKDEGTVAADYVLYRWPSIRRYSLHKSQCVHVYIDNLSGFEVFYTKCSMGKTMEFYTHLAAISAIIVHPNIPLTPGYYLLSMLSVEPQLKANQQNHRINTPKAASEIASSPPCTGYIHSQNPLTISTEHN